MTKKDTNSHISVPREEYEKLLAQAGKKRKKSSSSSNGTASSKASPNQRKKSEKRQRTKCLPVRLTPAEHSYLKEVSASSGLKMGAYIRQSVLGVPGDRAQSAPSPNKEALAMLLAHIGKVGGNINQLAKRANSDGFGAITEEQFIDMKAQISAMRAMLMVALKPNGN
jgi:hypothetical protein